MNVAVIKAGGKGTRMHYQIPKQFIIVKGKPIIVYTLAAFQEHPDIDRIIVVCLDGWERVLSAYAAQYGITKLFHIVPGGETSLRSIKNGIECARQFCKDGDTIIIHDGNRPFVSQEIISDVLVKSSVYGSAVAALQCTDEVMRTEAEDDTQSRCFLDRKRIFRIQTPDAYKWEIISKLIESASEDELDHIGATNTLSIAHGNAVYFSLGSTVNIRLTTQEDIALLDSLLEIKNARRD